MIFIHLWQLRFKQIYIYLYEKCDYFLNNIVFCCRRLAKSILVLIPLFGVHYIVFLGLPDKHVNETAQLVKLYFEMFFNSIQVRKLWNILLYYTDSE